MEQLRVLLGSVLLAAVGGMGAVFWQNFVLSEFQKYLNQQRILELSGFLVLGVNAGFRYRRRLSYRLLGLIGVAIALSSMVVAGSIAATGTSQVFALALTPLVAVAIVKTALRFQVADHMIFGTRSIQALVASLCGCLCGTGIGVLQGFGTFRSAEVFIFFAGFTGAIAGSIAVPIVYFAWLENDVTPVDACRSLAATTVAGILLGGIPDVATMFVTPVVGGLFVMHAAYRGRASRSMVAGKR